MENSQIINMNLDDQFNQCYQVYLCNSCGKEMRCGNTTISNDMHYFG